LGRLRRSIVAKQHVSAHLENFSSERSIYFSKHATSLSSKNFLVSQAVKNFLSLVTTIRSENCTDVGKNPSVKKIKNNPKSQSAHLGALESALHFQRAACSLTGGLINIISVIGYGV
jgi:hypothetical protein